MKSILTPMARVYMYGVVIALLPVLVAFGVLDAEILPVLIPLVVAIFNVDLGTKGKHEAE